MEFLRCFLKVTETFIFKRRANHQNAGWELALSIFALLLKIDHIIEQLWAIRTYQKSNREQFAQVAHDKRAIMSELFLTVSPLFMPKSELLPLLFARITFERIPNPAKMLLTMFKLCRKRILTCIIWMVIHVLYIAHCTVQAPVLQV